MDYLKDPRGLMAIRMVVEGCSIRTVERLTEIRPDTIIDLLLIAGQRCEKLMDSLCGVPATDVQMDEMWNFVYCKEKNKGPEDAHNDEIGDCYNWVAIDRPTKLALVFVCGRRTNENAMELARKVRRATSAATRFQLTTYGLHAYIATVDEMFLDRCDYAQLVKTYAQPAENEKRYSPAECTGAVKVVISGNPDQKKICTSHGGAPESHHAGADSTVNPANERLQQEAGESPSRYRAALRVLQFLPDSRFAARHACDGSGDR